MAANDDKTVTLVDYGAGNVRSVRNAIRALGYTVKDVTCADDINNARKLVFPGVGSFGAAMKLLNDKGWVDAIQAYIAADRPFMGVCLGMQLLFEGSEETPGVKGIGVIPGIVGKFQLEKLSVPHMGWNGVRVQQPQSGLCTGDECVYFVHSYRALATPANKEWVLTLTDYGEEPFISSVQKGNVMACQFHPEKSGKAGLGVFKAFLDGSAANGGDAARKIDETPTKLAKRVIACLDVRSNDNGDIVVTKGDQYDCREEGEDGKKVRNLGMPVDLAERYYKEGADEVTFLNITSFRESPLEDAPMLEVLKRTSETVFVPLCIGGGIRAYTDGQGRTHSALDVASHYFRAGADKVSIGSDAVYAAVAFIEAGGLSGDDDAKAKALTGETAIETISHHYGVQAVVISVDPRRVYVNDPKDTPHHCVAMTSPSRYGPNGEKFAWYQCTVRGGREGRDLDTWQLAKACEAMGAGELLINCIDNDGQKQGFDLDLLNDLSKAVSIPCIASSGAGAPEHFTEVFKETPVEAGLAAGIFHHRLVAISAVKDAVAEAGFGVRK